MMISWLFRAPVWWALAPPHHDAVGPALHHPQEQVGVLLLVGGLGAVALDVGHGAVHGQVPFLDIGHEFFEVFKVMGAVFFVDLKGGGIDGVEGVHAHAALEARGGLLAQQALHLHFLDEILGGAVNVGEAVDPPAGLGGNGGHKILVLGHLGQIVGHAHAVEGGTQDRVVSRAVDLFAEHIDLQVQFADGCDVFFSGHQCHGIISFPRVVGPAAPGAPLALIVA